MRTLALAVLLAGAASPRAGLLAQPAPAGEKDEEARLLAILSEETVVATKARLNADFVPGIVTVLHGEELEALGVETAWEALSLVPGLQAVRDAAGTPSVTVRGLDFPFNSGNVKVLVDGVSLNRDSAGVNGIALQIPVQQIDRIEVIRGPGSVLYGDFAFMGLVNIVTRREGARAYARWGGDQALSGGIQETWKDARSGWGVSLLGAGWKSNDAPVVLPRGAQEKRGWGAVTVENGGFALSAEGLSRRVDDRTSGGGAPTTSAQAHGKVEGRYARDLGPALHAEARISLLHDRFETSMTYFSGGVLGGGADLTWSGWKGQTWLAGFDASAGTIDDARRASPPPNPGAPPPPPPIAIADQHRDAFGITLQDTIDLGSRLAVTAGGRFDRYSDIGSRFTPRVAVVFRASDEHVLKLQYAEGFRGPTFFELYSSNVRQEDLSFEVNRTAELNYVFRRSRSVTRATLFFTRLTDMIFVAGPTRFGNDRRAESWGVELEAERQLSDRLKVQANASFFDARDDRNPQTRFGTIASSPSWLGNLAASFRAAPGTLLTARWNHVGRRPASTDPRGYDLVDVTATRQGVLPGLELRLGVKNAFNDPPRYLQQRPDGGITLSPFTGRTWFVQLTYAR